MASVVITNLRTYAVPLGDLGSKSLAASEVVTIDRPTNALPAMKSLIAALAAGDISVTVTPTAAEIASGFLSPPQSVQAQDTAPVAAADVVAGVPFTIRKAFVAAAAGTADDVEIIAANALPRKFRVLSAVAYFPTAIGSSTAQLRSRAAGAGTLLGAFDSSVAVSQSSTPPATITPGALEGLFLRRSDRGVAGEVVVTCQAES